jgi:acyl-coenzyme A synthetase/AMP-(fatty) acid ligase
MNKPSKIFQLLADKDNQRIIAYDEHTQFTLQDLQNQVIQIRAEIIKQENKKWILAIEEVFSFAAGFLALATLNRTIILPPNLKQGALEDICQGGEIVLTDKTYSSCKFSTISIPTLPKENILPALNLTNSPSCQLELFTSGSSGEPKKITKTLENLEAELIALEKNWGKTVNDAVFFSTVTHLHIYGLLFRLLWPLTTGRPFFNKSYLFPDDLLKAMIKFSAAILISSPAHLKRIPQMTSTATFCQKIKLIVSSGGPLAFETSNIYTTETRLTPLEVFGSTETGGIAWRQQTAINTPWQTFDSIQIKQDQETGTLSLKSPFIPDPDWYHTSDLIELISSNTFLLKGRADRIVKIEEKRIGLAHLETKIIETGIIEDAYVTVLTDDSANGRISLGCLIALNAQGLELFLTTSWKNIIETLRKKLGLFFDDILIPRQWRIVSEIPLNLQGKKVASDLKKFFTPVAPKQPLVLNTEKTETTLKSQIYIPADFFFFQGHFDNFPILPGVAQINMAIEFAKNYFEIPGKFYQMINIKFKRVIRPGTILILNIQRDFVKNTATFSFENAQDKFSSGVIKFKVIEKESV